MKSIVKRISHLFESIVLAAIVLAGSLSIPMTVTAIAPDVCTAQLDVVLVFDRSASMAYGTSTPPMQPLTDAQDATVAFIDILDDTDDKVGLVDFADGATTTNSLTFGHTSVSTNVGLDWLGGWTNTGEGIKFAHEELSDNGRDGVKKVIVLLSDGNPTKPTNESVAEAYAYEKATEAKADGIMIYTIGFGDDVNQAIMETIASDPSNYYYAPTSGELEDAYMELASDVCEPDIVTLTASKIVCEDESLLPNWSGESVNITADTATGYVDEIEGCSLESGWSFQWGDQNVSDPGGDYYGEVVGDGWTTFGPTDVDGVVSTEIDISGMTQIRVREVLQSGYIPFTHPEESDVTAEMWCSDDVLNYDNFDFIREFTDGGEYYCVAFNALEDANNPPVITVDPASITIFVGDSSFNPYDGHATANDAEDGDITADLVASSSVNTATSGIYYVEYDVVDSDGEAADTQTLEVNVVSEPPYGAYCGDGIVNQSWEQCDSTEGCSVQCQTGTPVCSEDVFVKAVITETQNVQENADMTEDIFLGTSTLPIPSGAWFPVYYNGSYVNDDSIEGYEDVPGIALQRDNGSITTRHYGSHPGDGTQEHVEGYLEFYNAGDLAISNDESDNGQNRMEGSDWNTTIPNVSTTITAGRDYAWTSATTSSFWMTVTVADDSYFTTYGLPLECEDVNQPPFADAGLDQTVLVGSSVAFDGTGSYDTDGTIVSYDWDFDNTNTGSGATTTST